jgi:hypothetical protein
LGAIYVRRATGVRRVDDQKTGPSFEILTPERVYILYGSGSEVDAWIDAITPLIPSGSKREESLKVIKSGHLTKQGGGFKVRRKRNKIKNKIFITFPGTY